MANASIKSAFERLWEHILAKLNTKSDIGHTHSYAGSSSIGGPANSVKGKINFTMIHSATGPEGTTSSSSTEVFDGSKDLDLTLNFTPSMHIHDASFITSGTLPIARGGTGASTLTSGAALIGNGTGAVTTRAITNNTSLGHIAYNTNLMTTNTLAYWNGAYASNGASNLTYCNRGAFGTIVTKNTGDYAAASHTHSQYYQSGSTAYFPGISLDTNGAYIYGESNSGNVLFRYRATSTSGYSYTNIAAIVSAINAKLPLSGGTINGNLNITGHLDVGVTSNSDYKTIYVKNSLRRGGLHVSAAANVGLFDETNQVWICRSDSSQITYMPSATIIVGKNANDQIFRPNGSGKSVLGTSGAKWNVIYAVNGNIQTSDRNLKKDFRTFNSNENYEKFFMDLKPMIFKFIEGTSNRDHFGFISQDIENSLYKFGFDDKSFAGFCKDIKIKEYENEEGNILQEKVLDQDGNYLYDYSLRYDEFISLNTYMIQKNVNEINSLKEENQLLKEKLQAIEDRLNGNL